MKKLAKIICLVLAAMVFCGVFAGCKPKRNANDVYVVFEAKDKAIFQKLIENFERDKAPYKVNPIWVGSGQQVDKQSTMIASKDAPDVIVGGDVHILSQQKILMPLDELVARDAAEVNLGDFIEEIIDPLKLDGKLYYLPDFFNTSMLYYNKSLFGQSSLAAPTDTWTVGDYYNAATKLTKKNADGDYEQYGSMNVIGWWGEWLIHMRQAGCDVFDKDGWVDIDNPKARAAIELYKDKAYLGKNESKAHYFLDAEGNKTESSFDVTKCAYGKSDPKLGEFIGGSIGMYYGGHVQEWGRYKDIKEFDWDIEILPQGLYTREGGELAINAYGIYKDSPNVNGAWEFVKYLTKQKTGDALKNFGYLSPRKSERDELLAVPYAERPAPKNIEAAYKTLQYNKALPRYSYFKYVCNTYIEPELSKALEGAITIEQALKNAQTRANSYIATEYKN